ncbi:hypothetical protein AB1K32_07610 [Metabacillus dongyingensis]|uniref:hypothetical protein n=1 Tax=Metabacillus dongyingensis TaxID=2874282 RepID=UPI003B8B3022
MIDLRKAIRNYLKGIHSSVYYQSAPKDAPFPYIVFDIPNYIDNGELQSLIVVDIDGWDRPNNGDTVRIETLMESINGNGNLHLPNGLNKNTLTTDKIVVSFYLDTKLPLVDDDPLIKRRKYTYQVRLFNKEWN